MNTPVPNLFIIGAMKAGTTSLHTYLGAHPDVYMSEPKEPGFFVPEMTYYPKGEDWYRSLFENAGDACVIGESSTHYAKLPLYRDVAPRIARYSPDARIIYLMRNPVDRSISHYWHNVRTLIERRPILQALRGGENYIAFSDYGMQLAPYIDAFGRDRILALCFEDLISDPRSVIAQVLTWLGVNPDLAPQTYSAENARPENFQRVRGAGLLNRFSHSRLWERVAPIVPRRLKVAGRSLSVTNISPRPDDDAAARAYLQPLMAEKVAALQELLGKDCPAWTSSVPTAPYASSER